MSDERWHRQTKAGGREVEPAERGDCVACTITSILGLPLTAIANCHGEGWWDRLQDECAKHGYMLAQLDLKLEPPPGYWIATLPSLNLGPEPDGREAWHSVVAEYDRLVFDPSLGKRYTPATFSFDAVVEGWILAPLDPASALARAEQAEAEREWRVTWECAFGVRTRVLTDESKARKWLRYCEGMVKYQPHKYRKPTLEVRTVSEWAVLSSEGQEGTDGREDR
jgi:hypothetical protein